MNVRCTVLILLFALAALGTARAQKENNIWYFGLEAGVDFNGPAPTALFDGRTNTIEGTASIADRNTGALLFYTDGDTVWNRTHRVMLNGTRLKGHKSSTQSAVIIQMPGDSTRYYIFTSDAGEYQDIPNDGIHWAIVDMKRDVGRGEVTTKQVQILPYATEKLTAVRQCNGRDYWVIGHNWGGNSFYAWPVTPTGVGEPVISPAGIVHGGSNNNVIGWMQPSVDGRRLATAIFGMDIVQLFDFDPLTGVVSSPITIRLGDTTRPYGVCFSPDITKLYVTQYNFTLEQFDITSRDSATIAASQTTIAGVGAGSLQLGPDGRIYVSLTLRPVIAVINNPNEAGIACGFQEFGVPLITGYSWAGLPNVINSFIPSTTASAVPEVTVCAGDTARLTAWGGTSYEWSPADGLSCTDCPRPTVVPNGTTTYTVRITQLGRCDIVDQVKVTVQPPPDVSGGADVDICPGGRTTLTATGAARYTWSPAAGLSCTDCARPVASPAATTTYTVRGVSAAGCVDSARVTVRVQNAIVVDAGLERRICKGDSVQLGANGGSQYLWSPAAGLSCTDCPEPMATPSVTTVYTVVVSNGGTCTGVDSVRVVVVDSVPTVTIEPVAPICAGDTVLLKGSGAGRFTWSPDRDLSCVNCAQPMAWPKTTTTYVATITNASGCFAVDSVTVVVSTPPVLSAGEDRFLCTGEDDTLRLTVGPGTSIDWSPKSGLSCYDCTAPVARPDTTTTYIVTGTVAGGCASYDTVRVVVLPIPSVELGADIDLCTGDSIRLLAPDGVRWRWEPAAGLSCADCPTPWARPLTTTTYRVTVFNESECFTSDSVTVTVHTKLDPLRRDDSICVGDGIRLSARPGATSYRWEPAAGLSCTDCASPIATPAVSTTYVATIAMSGSCVAADTFAVHVRSAATADAGPDVGICLGESTELRAGGGVAWSWSPAAGLSCTDCASPIASPAVTTIYRVAVTNAEGCTAIDSVTVLVAAPERVPLHIGRDHRMTQWGRDTIPVHLDASVLMDGVDTLFFALDYRAKTLEVESVLVDGTLLAGWRVEVTEQQPGRIAVRLVAQGAGVLRGPGEILRLALRGFLSDTLESELPFSFEIPGRGCVAIEPGPGFVRLDSICGLAFRLIEFTGSVYKLEQNNPNPFNPTTEIEFSLGLDGHTTLVVLDAAGRRVATLLDEHLAPGRYGVTWDASAMPSGLYYYRIVSGDWTATGRMMLVK